MEKRTISNMRRLIGQLIFVFRCIHGYKRKSLNRPQHRYNLNRNKTSKTKRNRSYREQIARLKTFSRAECSELLEILVVVSQEKNILPLFLSQNRPVTSLSNLTRKTLPTLQ